MIEEMRTEYGPKSPGAKHKKLIAALLKDTPQKLRE
jgi:hypothetical protein